MHSEVDDNNLNGPPTNNTAQVDAHEHAQVTNNDEMFL
jgi:hypothetical protein